MNDIIKSLNLTEGTVLTLERLSDRLEFEGLILRDESCDYCERYDPCLCDAGYDSCFIDGCDCYGPVGYINCHPYKG